MPGLCIVSGAALAKLTLAAFTLAWTPPGQQVRWEEDVRIDSDHLVVTEARIEGDGKGVDLPAGAVFERGFWRYRPPLPSLPEIELATSAEAPDWQLCQAGVCRSIGSYVAPDPDGYVLSACPD